MTPLEVTNSMLISLSLSLNVTKSFRKFLIITSNGV